MESFSLQAKDDMWLPHHSGTRLSDTQEDAQESSLWVNEPSTEAAASSVPFLDLGTNPVAALTLVLPSG